MYVQYSQYNQNAVKQQDLILTNTRHLVASSFNATANRTLNVLISGAPNDGFLQNTMKSTFLGYPDTMN